MNTLGNKSRLDWNDVDWATYLGCSVAQVAAYRVVLDRHFITAIERNKKSGQYSFALYRYSVSPSGFKRLQLVLSDNRSFNTLVEANRRANDIISTFELTDFWAKNLQMPKQAVQMMLVRER